ncbi:MAG: DUF423 domain-containing protein [Gemmatimonadetes bacterium]|nr:DUF423 domain-containing protein [Gemmatimonadota bacterium]
MERTFIATAALLALLSVMGGAFGAHALRGSLPPDRLIVFETGARYQMYHALAILLVFALHQWVPGSTRRLTAILFVAGIVLFSGSLYTIALTGIRSFGRITPLGGLLFLSGWIVLLIGVLSARNVDSG